jgi:hypothetical protein
LNEFVCAIVYRSVGEAAKVLDLLATSFKGRIKRGHGGRDFFPK